MTVGDLPKITTYLVQPEGSTENGGGKVCHGSGGIVPLPAE